MQNAKTGKWNVTTDINAVHRQKFLSIWSAAFRLTSRLEKKVNDSRANVTAAQR
jgi:hypothetical protein